MSCSKCTIFYWYIELGDDLKYHIAKNKVQQDPKTITRVKNAALSFQVFVPWNTRNNVITQQKIPQLEKSRRYKVLRTQEMTKARKKGYSRVDISWLIVKKKET